MRAYVIDQLAESEVNALAEHLADMDLRAGLEGIFWLPVPPALLTPI